METPDPHAKKKKSEFWSTLLISCAAVLSAWCAYQASRWYGEMTTHFSEAIAFRSESTKAEGDAGRALIVDMLTFQHWLDAMDHKDSLMALAIEDRFRDEFIRAFNDWRQLSEKGKAGLFAKGTPFTLPSYKPEMKTRADSMVNKAEIAFKVAKTDSRHGDDYIFTVVLFSLSLFFAAISDKVEMKFAIRLMLIMSTIFLLSGTIFILTLPVSIGF